MRDFTLKTYKHLTQSLIKSNYTFQNTQEFVQSHDDKCIIMRHDVDRKPNNALKIAKIENEFGIKATYYFRFVPESYDEKIINWIADLGHEIGYHYENMDTCNGDIDKAWDDFRYNLDKFNQLYPIKTICMHGSPLSKWDNRDLWNKYNYRDYGIIAEPYFDLDFNRIFYITDASRSWNNEKVSIRDKVESDFDIPVNSTNDIINLLKSENAPNQIMINIHPHNWAKDNFEWYKIFLWQGLKNIVKRIIIKLRNP